MSKEKSEITLKVFAIVIALILWIFVMDKENPIDSWPERNVSVSFNNIESLTKNELIIMSPEEAKVTVEVSGRKLDRINNFSSEDIKAEVDLSGYSEGQRKVPIRVTIAESSKLEITGWEPREILFDFEKIITKDKAVTIRTEGELAAGYVLGDISTKSEFIRLEGPRSWVNNVSDIVASVIITDRKEDIDVTRPIKLMDDQGNSVVDVESKPSIIDVFIPVYKTATVPIEIDTKGELPENYEIGDMEINPKTITLKGKEGIENLKVIQTKKIDINDFMENEDIIVELELPENVSLLNPDEEITASLKIEEAFTKTFEYILEEIEVRNLGPGLEIDYKDSPDIVEITLKGSQETIESLTEEDIQVYIDLNMLRDGEHDIYIGYNIPLDITVNEVIPQPISFSLVVSD